MEKIKWKYVAPLLVTFASLFLYFLVTEITQSDFWQGVALGQNLAVLLWLIAIAVRRVRERQSKGKPPAR